MLPDRQHGAITERRVFSRADAELFARLAGQAGPPHDALGLAATHGGAVVAHGMLLFSAIRGLIDRGFPGSRLLRQRLTFLAPTFCGEAVVLELRPLCRTAAGLRLETLVCRPDGSLSLQGECELLLGSGTA